MRAYFFASLVQFAVRKFAAGQLPEVTIKSSIDTTCRIANTVMTKTISMITETILEAITEMIIRMDMEVSMGF